MLTFIGVLFTFLLVAGLAFTRSRGEGARRRRLLGAACFVACALLAMKVLLLSLA